MKFVYLFFFTLFLFCNCAPGTEKSSSETDSQSQSVFTDINVKEFKEMMKADNTVILDVRTPEETAEGKIPGAIEIDIRQADFADKVAALDKDKTYLVYCRSGVRSVTACKHLTEHDFKSLYNLKGGYGAWRMTEE